MDVRCEKCGTEYEFDDERIGEAGVTVRCTECEHVFKVRRRSFTVTEPVAPEPGSGGVVATDAKPWLLRKTTGETFTFDSLSTLHKWIVERRAVRDDEVSRSGGSWKKLGDIAELATFFRVVEDADRARAAAAEPSPAPSTGAPPVQPPPPPPAAVAPEPPAPPPPTPAPAPSPPPAVAPTPTPAPVRTAATAARPTTSPSWTAAAAPPAPDVGTLAEEDFSDFKRGGAGKWIVLVLVLLLAGGAGGFYYMDPDRALALVGLGGVPDEARAELATGWEALQRDTDTAFTDAGRAFESALALAGRADFPEAHAALAEARIVKALALEADGDEENEARVGALLDEALEHAETAQRLDPDAFTTLRAMAAYYAAIDAGRRFEGLAGRAEALPEGARDARLAWLSGVVALRSGDVESAEAHLRRALERDGGFVRARFDLARSLAAAERTDDALAEARRVIEASEGHRRAKAFVEALETPDAVADETPEEPPAVVQPAAATQEPAPPPRRRTYDGMLQQAFRARNRGQVEQALDLYARAVDMDPTRGEAYAGQGFCYIEMRAWHAAIAAFEQSLERNSRYGDAIIGLAEAHRHQGNTDQARRFYERYLELFPEGPEAPVARTNLERM